jgi:signal transduction histidine kinase
VAVTSERIVYLLAHDVTQSKLLDQMKDEFVATVAHELRTPLTSMHGALQLLASGVFGALPTDMEAMVASASRGSTRLVKLVNDLLDAERLESGRYSVDREPIDAAALADMAVATVVGMANDYGVEIVTDVAPCALHVGVG